MKSFHKILKTIKICKLGLNTYSRIIDIFQSSRWYSGAVSPDQKSVFQSDLYPTNWRWGWRHTMTIHGPPHKWHSKQKASSKGATLPLGPSDPDASWGHQLKVKVRSPLDPPQYIYQTKALLEPSNFVSTQKVPKCRTNSWNVP